MLASAKWKTVSWRSGKKGRLKARFAALSVRTADGSPQRIWDKGQQHLTGEEDWLIGEQRDSGEKKYYLANLKAATDLRTLPCTSLPVFGLSFSKNMQLSLAAAHVASNFCQNKPTPRFSRLDLKISVIAVRDFYSCCLAVIDFS